VLVLSIPDWGVTPFAGASGRAATQIAAELDAFNGAARAACATRDVAFVDITPLSRERGAQPAMLAADGLHPSAAMHALWAQMAVPVARRLLSA
jgi:lysophospholipase L1-like esterase